MSPFTEANLWDEINRGWDQMTLVQRRFWVNHLGDEEREDFRQRLDSVLHRPLVKLCHGGPQLYSVNSRRITQPTW